VAGEEPLLLIKAHQALLAQVAQAVVEMVVVVEQLKRQVQTG
jgi:uncharacterized protein YicC (UPF0701 family)